MTSKTTAVRHSVKMDEGDIIEHDTEALRKDRQDAIAFIDRLWSWQLKREGHDLFALLDKTAKDAYGVVVEIEIPDEVMPEPYRPQHSPNAV